MAYSVVRTDKFKNDYDRILDYLCNVFGASSAALRLMDEVEHVVTIIENSPFIMAISDKR